jgi:hypothetical protein
MFLFQLGYNNRLILGLVRIVQQITGLLLSNSAISEGKYLWQTITCIYDKA